MKKRIKRRTMILAAVAEAVCGAGILMADILLLINGKTLLVVLLFPVGIALMILPCPFMASYDRRRALERFSAQNFNVVETSITPEELGAKLGYCDYEDKGDGWFMRRKEDTAREGTECEWVDRVEIRTITPAELIDPARTWLHPVEKDCSPGIAPPGRKPVICMTRRRMLFLFVNGPVDEEILNTLKATLVRDAEAFLIGRRRDVVLTCPVIVSEGKSYALDHLSIDIYTTAYKPIRKYLRQKNID